MVAAIIAAVGGDQHEGRKGLALWHLAGLILGASALALALSAIGLVLSPSGLQLAAILGLAAIAWGSSSLLGRPLPVLSSGAQVPLAWSYTMAPAQYSFSYGIGLGLGVLTRVRSFSTYAFLVLIVLLHNALIGVGVALFYAVARSVPVLVAAFSHRGVEEFIEKTEGWRAMAAQVDALVLLLVGFALTLASVS